MKKARTKALGFTLVELLVVVSVISLLSSIVMASLNSARAKARDAYRLAQVNEVVKALALYQTTNGNYPWAMPFSDVEVPQVWQSLMQVLTNAGYISATFSYEPPAQRNFSLIKKAFAVAGGGGPVYYPSSIQDPLYKAAADYPTSFGYTVLGPGSGYKVRVKLENTSHPALQSSSGGSFIGAATTGADACDASLGYYCKSN